MHQQNERASNEDIARQLHFHLFEINEAEDPYFIIDPKHGSMKEGFIDFNGWLPLVEIVRFVRSKLTS